MRNRAGDLLLFAINWEAEPLSCEVALPSGHDSDGSGFAIGSTGSVSQIRARAEAQAQEARLRLDLAAQEARVLRFAGR